VRRVWGGGGTVRRVCAEGKSEESVVAERDGAAAREEEVKEMP